MYSGISEEEAEVTVQTVKEILPDDAELALLSFTGGRAFGWGNDHHDIDAHGLFVKEDWFRQCHTDRNGRDITVRNMDSFEDPRLETQRFKKYYDYSKPLFVHDEFDFEGYMNTLEPSTIYHVFPYDIQLQLSRFEKAVSDRNALHSYKEMLIPLHFLRTGEIESNIVENINPKPAYQYEWLDKCAESYKYPESNIDLDEDEIWEELDDIWDRLEEAMPERE